MSAISIIKQLLNESLSINEIVTNLDGYMNMPASEWENLCEYVINS